MALYGVELWSAVLLFARLGGLLMLLPGFGEQAIPALARLTFALMLTILLAPVLGPSLPPAPTAFGAALGALLSELILGLALGMLARLLFSALDTAGNIVGIETGLAFAQIQNPSSEQSAQIFGAFLSLLGVTLILVTDLHHGFLRAIAGSYGVFAPGAALDGAAFAELAVRMTGDAFRIAIQIAAPVLIVGLVYRAGLGVLARVIPQIQVFFITIPINLLGGFLIFALGLSAGMLVWLDRMGQFATSLE